MKSWKIVIRLLVGAALVAGLLVSPANVVAHDNDQLSAVRHATAKFHSIPMAEAAGYAKALPCFDRPGVGGMGQHYVNFSLANGTLTPTKPQALVYEVDGDELTLVAVEYIVPYQVLPATSQPPQLFGHAFFRNDPLSLWALHAWIWRENPLGTFANYNPRVSLCPGHQSED
jgi:hypothetical protein